MSSWWVSLAEGAVPDGFYLVRMMVESMGFAETLFISHEVTVLPKNHGEGAKSFREIIMFRHPDDIRLEFITPERHEIRIVTRNDAVRIVDGEMIPTPPIKTLTEPELVRYLLLHRRPDDIARMLMSQGIDLSITGLGRLNGKTTYVMGAVYPDESVPQLWLDKETFLPIRLIPGKGTSRNGESRPEWDIRYRDWKKYQDVMYPAETLFIVQNRPMRRNRVQEVTSHPFFENSLFDIERARIEYPEQRRFSEGMTDKKDRRIPEVEEILKEFNQLFIDKNLGKAK